MPTQNVTHTPKPQSHDHAINSDFNRMFIDHFEMESHDHLVGKQLNFLVDHIVRIIFNDKFYMDVCKSEFLDKLRSEIQEEHMLAWQLNPREFLDVLVKHDTLMMLKEHFEYVLETSLDSVAEFSILGAVFDEIREDRESWASRPSPQT